MKIKFLCASIAAFVLTVSVAFAQTKPTPKSEIIKVWGNCGMCKTTIETAAKMLVQLPLFGTRPPKC